MKKKDRISALRSQMWEILNVLETTSYKEFEETHVPVVESGLLDIRSKLPMFPQSVITTVARRPAGQQKRRGAGGGAAAKRTAPATRTATQHEVVIIRTSESSSDSDVPESNIFWNESTRRMEYRSSGQS